MSIDADVAAALRALGITPASVETISGLTLASGDRATFRVRSTDGARYKVRRATRAESAERMARWVAALGALRIPRVLHREGRITVEEWIEGAPLADLALDDGRILRAAELLASILAAKAARDEGTEDLLADTERRIATLAAQRAITAGEARALVAIARATAPASAAVAIVHHDFTAENLVEDGAGAIWVVDNGGLREDFLDLAVARTRVRWPMSEASWSTFLSRLRLPRGFAPAAADAPFWLVAAAARSAHFRATRGAPGVDAALSRLRGFAGVFSARGSRAR